MKIGRIIKGGAEAAGHFTNVLGNAAQLHEHVTTQHPSRLRKALNIGVTAGLTTLALLEAAGAAAKVLPKLRRTRP